MTQTQTPGQMPLWGTSLLMRLFPTLLQQQILEEANRRLFQTYLEKDSSTMPKEETNE